MTSIFSRLQKLEAQIKRLPTWQRIPLQVQLSNVRAQLARRQHVDTPTRST